MAKPSTVSNGQTIDAGHINDGYDWTDELVHDLPWKESVFRAADVNVDVVSAPATIDGAAISPVWTLESRRVLLLNQTNPIENGPWVWVDAAQPMVRPDDFTTAVQARCSVFRVRAGTYAEQMWTVTGDPDPGTSSVSLARVDVDAAKGYRLDEFAAATNPIQIVDGVAVTDAATVQQTSSFLAVDAKTANYTLTLSDVGKLITTDSNVTIPNNSNQAIPVGSQIGILATGGTPNVVDQSSVTLNGETTGAASLLMTVHQIVVATKIGPDVWNISGV